MNPWSAVDAPHLADDRSAHGVRADGVREVVRSAIGREEARADRIHGAEGVIPVPVWIVLLLASAVIFVYMLFFADSAERAVVQATMMGGVAS